MLLKYDEPSGIRTFFEAGMARKLPLLQFPDPNLVKLNVGGGQKQIGDSINLDQIHGHDLREGIPYDDESVGEIYAFHFLEHLDDPVWMLREFERVLAPGGVANICVPYYNAMLQAQSLDHKHSFCEETWKTLFYNDLHSGGQWKFKVGLNVIMGLNERNLCLLTQLIRMPEFYTGEKQNYA